MPSAFLAVWSSSGAALPDGALALVERMLPFQPDCVDARAEENATLWSWRLDEHLTGAEQWTSQATGSAALVGYGIDAEGERLAAQTLVHGPDLVGPWTRFHGEWSACTLTAGRLTAGSSAIGTEHVYLVKRPRFVALASRARLLWAILQAFGEPLEPDLDALATLLSLGHPFCTDRTAVLGVTLIESTQRVSIDVKTGATHVEACDPRFFVPDREGPPPMWSALADSAARNVSWLASAHVPIITAITGGKDSRLVLSLIRAAGLLDKVDRFSVGAPPEHADAIVAHDIAERFGLRFERTERNSQPDLDGALTLHVGFTEGLLSAWDLNASTSYSPRVHIHGLLGEIYRGRPTTASLDFHRIANEILPRTADFAGLLRPDVLREQHHRIATWLRGLAADGVDLAYARDAFYLRQRVPRWVGQARLRAGLEGLHFNPLFSLPVLKAYWGLPALDRRGERAHFEIMGRCWPELLEVPFADARWTPEMVARSSLPATRVAAPRHHSRPIVGTGWQIPALTTQFAHIVARVEARLPDLASIVARERVHDLLQVLELVLGVSSSPVRWSRAALRSPALLARSNRNPRPAVSQLLALLTVIETFEACRRDRAVEVRVL